MKTPDEMPLEMATANLMHSFSTRRSRRALLKGAAIGVTGVAAVAAGGLLIPKHAAHASGGGEGAEDTVVQILSIAATAEELAVTFYSHGIAKASKLGISGPNLAYLQAAVIEEQIHRDFEVAAGGKPLTNTFSFPHGDETFEHLDVFIATLEELEEAFIAAYLAAVKEFALLGQAGLAQLAAQICGIENEHRALGRDIGGLIPADNWAFSPALVESVGDAVDVLAAEGFLSPKGENSFTYHHVSTADHGVIRRQPFTAGEDND